MGAKGRVPLILALFASGVAGLLYETLWARYLGLLLGHAAWAQSLVLALYMGGMAAGAALGARSVGQAGVRRLLWAFAAVEAVLGVLAIGFPSAFDLFDRLAYGVVLPTIGPAGVWVMGALLVLPAAVALGATWPLASAAAARWSTTAQRGGASGVAWIYAANTLGAAIGAVACGPLVAALDLDGALRAAGVLDLVVAAWIVGLAWVVPTLPVGAVEQTNTGGDVRLLYLTAAATGLASFAYEIAWTRMLALVLGSSTRAFELMLATFLLGLALGGLLIRGRLGPGVIARLGRVQVAMGLAALASLPLYHLSFDAMVALFAAVDRTEAGWLAWSAGSAAIAALVMLPATLLAGMTLPLLSAAVLARGGPALLGRVWAANTVGSIAGVLLAVHVGLPMLGVADVVRVGAALDLAIGVVLLRGRPVAMAIAVVALVVSALTPTSALRMASGVYRTGELLPDTTEVLYAADGRTASVALTREGPLWSLRTNGKPDAALRMDDTPAFDEPTMVLLGALPMLLHPDARQVANVGLGSGLTTHTVLADPRVERVDTVEIEPAMIEAARLFGDRVSRTFADPRSVLHVADARTIFAARGGRYDVLVSEPSNPWVSGVAGLFSKEHYARSREWVAPGGLFVQWLQAYEIDERLLASVLAALSLSYPAWEVWAANGGDLIVVASDTAIPTFDGDFGAFAGELERVGIRTPEDLALRRIGGRALLEPLFAATGAPANSERAPLLELEAPRALFLGASVPGLAGGALDALPLGMLEGRGGSTGEPTWTMDVPRVPHRAFGRMLAEFHRSGAWVWSHPDDPLPPAARTFAEQARAALRCEPQPLGAWMDGMFNSFALRTLPHLERQEAMTLLSPVSGCVDTPIQSDMVALLLGLSERDAPAIATYARVVLDRVAWGDAGFVGWVLGAAMVGDLAQGHAAEARAVWAAESERLDDATRGDLVLRLLVAHAEERRFGARTSR